MIIKLDSGKELTLEEVKEVIEKFKGIFKEKEDFFVHFTQPVVPFEYQPYKITYPDNTEYWYTPTYCSYEEAK